MTVYFIGDADTVTLPAATTAGQQLILLDANVLGDGFYLTTNSADTLNNEATTAITGKGGTVGPFGTAILISDGSHHWYASYSN
jgi:hypothetical protein